MKVDVNIEEVLDFISEMNRAKADLNRSLDNVRSCRSVQGWDDSNRQLFDASARDLEKEIMVCINGIEDTIRELEKIVEAAKRIKY